MLLQSFLLICEGRGLMNSSSYLASSTFIHRKGSFLLLFLSDFKMSKWFSKKEGIDLYILPSSSLPDVEENINTFCQNLQTLWGQQYVYKIHAKTQKIKKDRELKTTAIPLPPN